MFVKSFITFFGCTVRAPQPLRVAAFEQLYVVSKQVSATAPAGVCGRASETHTWLAAGHLRRAGKMAAREAIRVAYAGSPLTPTGYAILAMTVVAVALVAMLSASPVGSGPSHTRRLSWWFS